MDSGVQEGISLGCAKCGQVLPAFIIDHGDGERKLVLTERTPTVEMELNGETRRVMVCLSCSETM